MFNSEQVKGFILHPERIVCNTALRYFADSFLYENDTTLMPLLLDRLKQSTHPGAVGLYHGYRFPQTEETVRDVLALSQSSSMDPNTKIHLLNMLCACDHRLLIPYEEFIAQEPLLQKRVQQKRELANMEDRELIDAFRLFIEQSTGKYVNEFDTTYGNEIVNELARRRCIDPEAVLQKLDAYDPDDFSYETPYFAQLAGAMKLDAAIPSLCGFLGAVDDWLPERAGEALVHIGTASVVTALADQYFSAEAEYFRLYASDVFGNIKHPASEEALLALLPEEQHLTYATKLANSLCELGSSKGLPLVQAMVEEGNFDSRYMNLTESIYAYCVISNTPHPLLSQWKKELEMEEARIAKREKQLKSFVAGGNFQSGSELHTKTTKVGRNDPCPCGSGKKHKKCCGA
ncbi:MAG: hypothetical protein K0R57_4729 [Paenibacillaceae bacterium]|jgi:hypothetical protein|nr:hypothetical protein [Paenibacillaceae bacterium]